jgi:hypothetical protein
MDWIDLAQDMDRWWALVITVISLQGISGLAEDPLDCQEELCSM